jgi:hypothetical protein
MANDRVDLRKDLAGAYDYAMLKWCAASTDYKENGGLERLAKYQAWQFTTIRIGRWLILEQGQPDLLKISKGNGKGAFYGRR